jgi:hypothetical protein
MTKRAADKIMEGLGEALQCATLRNKLAETIAPMLTPNAGGNAGLVGRATRKKAEAIADAVIARIHGEGLSFVDGRV